jgi:hypothetical protein
MLPPVLSLHLTFSMSVASEPDAAEATASDFEDDAGENETKQYSRREALRHIPDIGEETRRPFPILIAFHLILPFGSQ